MGLFNWKKKAPYPFNPLLETLDCLHKVLGNSEIKGDCVVLSAEQLTIRPEISNVKDGFAALYFEVSHPTFEEPFSDMSAGVGETAADAIHKAVASFLFSGFCGVRHCVNKEYERTLTSTFCGTERLWNVSESCIAHLGVSDSHTPPPYWELIADMLPAHLGNRKHYWIKVYVSKQQSGEVICECRVNNTVSEELTKAITAPAQAWKSDAAIVSDKQWFILTQSDDTIMPYPYTREQIFDYTDQAIALFPAADTEEKHERLVDDFTAMTDDSSLAAELYSFLPEICAQNAFSKATYGEQIVLFRGEQKLELYIDQLTSYRWIQERAAQSFSEGRHSNETFKKLIYSSATCNVLSKALNDGSQMEDLALTSLAFIMPDDYVIR